MWSVVPLAMQIEGVIHMSTGTHEYKMIGTLLSKDNLYHMPLLVDSLAGQLIWADEKIYLGRLKIWVN